MPKKGGSGCIGHLKPGPGPLFLAPERSTQLLSSCEWPVVKPIYKPLIFLLSSLVSLSDHLVWKSDPIISTDDLIWLCGLTIGSDYLVCLSARLTCWLFGTGPGLSAGRLRRAWMGTAPVNMLRTIYCDFGQFRWPIPPQLYLQPFLCHLHLVASGCIGLGVGEHWLLDAFSWWWCPQ